MATRKYSARGPGAQDQQFIQFYPSTSEVFNVPTTVMEARESQEVTNFRRMDSFSYTQEEMHLRPWGVSSEMKSSFRPQFPLTDRKPNYYGQSFKNMDDDQPSSRPKPRRSPVRAPKPIRPSDTVKVTPVKKLPAKPPVVKEEILPVVQRVPELPQPVEPPRQEEPPEEEEQIRVIRKKKKKRVINFIEENKKHLKGRPPREPSVSYITVVTKSSKSVPKTEQKTSPEKKLKKSISQKPARRVSKKKKKSVPPAGGPQGGPSAGPPAPLAPYAPSKKQPVFEPAEEEKEIVIEKPSPPKHIQPPPQMFSAENILAEANKSRELRKLAMENRLAESGGEHKPHWLNKSNVKNRVRDDSEIVVEPSGIEKLKDPSEKAEIFSLPGNRNNYSELYSNNQDDQQQEKKDPDIPQSLFPKSDLVQSDLLTDQLDEHYQMPPTKPKVNILSTEPLFNRGMGMFDMRDQQHPVFMPPPKKHYPQPQPRVPPLQQLLSQPPEAEPQGYYTYRTPTQPTLMQPPPAKTLPQRQSWRRNDAACMNSPPSGFNQPYQRGRGRQDPNSCRAPMPGGRDQPNHSLYGGPSQAADSEQPQSMLNRAKERSILNIEPLREYSDY